MTYQIHAHKLFNGHAILNDQVVSIDQGKISDIRPFSTDATSIDLVLADGILAPGFIDLQVNGGGGILFNNHRDIAALEQMAAGHRAFGTTRILPTVITDTNAVLMEAISVVAAALANNTPGILGIHIEGPFFSSEKRGVHRQDLLQEASDDIIEQMAAQLDFPSIVTVAPEKISERQIQLLTQQHVRVFLGHSNADYQTAAAALAAGANGFTHLFNAMSPMDSREPGMVGAALSSSTAYAGIIADGYHVHPACIAVAQAALAERLFLVSDSMATIGSDNKSFELYGETITEQDQRLVNQEGKLAGSAISLLHAIQYAQQHSNFSLEHCLKMASTIPAKCMGVDDQFGAIKPGYVADLVHLDASLQVTHTWLAGELNIHNS